MSVSRLGLEVDSKPVEQATIDLDKLVAASERAETGAVRLGKGSRDLGASMQALVEATRNIERHTELMAMALGKGTASAEALGVSATSATAHIRAMDAALAQATSDLPAVATATGRASAGFVQEAAAVRAATDAIERNTAAARENSAVRAAATPTSGFNSANIAAQFQDIGVTAAMGQSPFQIALQQGTQLSAVLQQIKGNGQSTAAALVSAFASVVSPVSLITMGLIAGGAAAIQWGISAMNSTEDATTALERHNEWLTDLVKGYDRAGDAVERALNRGSTLPQGVVISDLGASLAGQDKKIEEYRATVKGLISDWDMMAERAANVAAQVDSLSSTDPAFGTPQDLVDQAKYIGLLQDMNIGLDSTQQQLIRAAVAAKQLYNETKDPALKNLASEAYDLATNLLSTENAAYAARAALAALNNGSILDAALAASEKYNEAVQQIVRLTPELRTAREQLNDALNAALASGDAPERQGAMDQYRKAIEALDEQDRRREAQKASNRQSPDDRWGTATENFEARLRSLQAENDAMGMLTFESERHKAAMDLENQAYQAGMEITPKVHDRILELAGGYASLRLAAEGTQIVLANRSPWEAMQEEVQKLNELMGEGTITARDYSIEVGKAVEDMVGKYASAASGVLGSAQNLSDALFDMEKGRIENSGLAGDELTAAMERQAKEQFEINKQLSIASAVVTGGEAIVRAYNAGMVFGIPGAIASASIAAVATAAQIAAIASSSYHSKSISAVASSSSGVSAPAQEPMNVLLSLHGDRNTPTTLGASQDLFEQLMKSAGERGVRIVTKYVGEN